MARLLTVKDGWTLPDRIFSTFHSEGFARMFTCFNWSRSFILFCCFVRFFFCLFELPLFHTRWQSSVFCLRTELVNISHTALQARMKLSVLFQPIDFCQTHSHTLLLCSDCSSLLFLRLLFFFFDSKLDIWLLTVSSIKDKKYVSEKY